jgi:hypothetical protein
LRRLYATRRAVLVDALALHANGITLTGLPAGGTQCPAIPSADETESNTLPGGPSNFTDSPGIAAGTAQPPTSQGYCRPGELEIEAGTELVFS